MAHSAAILNAGEMCRIEGRGSGCSPRKRVCEIREARYAALLALPRDVDLPHNILELGSTPSELHARIHGTKRKSMLEANRH